MHEHAETAPATEQAEIVAKPTAPAPANAPSLTSAAAVIALQRQVGNRATTRLLQRVGADGRITDPAEMERTRPVGGTVDATTRTRVFNALRRAPRAQAIFTDIERRPGGVNFPTRWSRRGTYHSRGEVWLDRNGTYDSWVAGLAHELIHLQTYLAGRAANIQTMTRDAFVTAKMADEINAHAASYVTLLQLGRRNASTAGFAAFQQHLARTAPNAIRGRQWAAIEASARTWLESRYRTDPAWRTSNTRENYYDYWGGAWDRAHPPARVPARPAAP